MADSRKCTSCGAEVPPGTPGEFCVRCGFQFAMGVETEQAPTARTLKVEVRDPSPSEKAGDRLGRYKLLQKIGEGGCGVVYMAEQEEPVRRRVALKVIKLGMDTREVIARFEAERQALALMDHPNIAKVLDAGATETGRPYFVMELVRGVKITEYCDQNNVSTRERLNLFTQICRAVQHAHQKGIIHRDLKPSNLLVTMADGVPIPKVIDFGIAKATQGRLTDQTLFTAFEQFIGTPAYMSPEQAEMSAIDIDTRSDVYSLGVLLYELLTGKTPFDSKELLKAGLDEMRRTIREKEPARPSTRLSTMVAADLTTAAKHRQTEAPKLVSFVRGDLDWIVMKCLEKDRTRRYETANGLAADLQRHLNDEPVSARPPSRLYRFQKLVRRNKLAVGAVFAVSLALLLGAGASTWQAIRATRAERLEARLLEEAKASEAIAQVEVRVDKLRYIGKFAEAETLCRNALTAVRKVWPNEPAKWEAALRPLMGILMDQHKFEDAEQLFNQVLTPDIVAQLQSAELLKDRALLFVVQHRWKEAAADLSKAAELDPSNNLYRFLLAPLQVQIGDTDGYRLNCAQLLARFGDTADPINAERVAKPCLILPDAGVDLDAVGKLAEISVSKGKNHPFFAYFMVTKALAELRQGHFASAIDWMQQFLAGAAKVPPQNTLDRNLTASAHLIMAMAEHHLKREKEARASLASGSDLIDPEPGINGTWNDWLVAQALLKEARALIEGQTTTAK